MDRGQRRYLMPVLTCSSLTVMLKHATCSAADRVIIYGIKNKMVELLYMNGYCTECYPHVTELPSKECWSCDGTGVWESYGQEGDRCLNCNGTGVHLPAKTLTFVCFRFVVEEQTYCWHQPEESGTVHLRDDGGIPILCIG